MLAGYSVNHFSFLDEVVLGAVAAFAFTVEWLSRQINKKK
jgi:hypothetical protein